MLIEGLRPLCLVLANHMVRLVPGYPVYFSDEQARKILRKAGDKVRVVNDGSLQVKDGNQNLIMWESDTGSCGPANVMALDSSQGCSWILVQYQGNWLWVHESRVICD